MKENTDPVLDKAAVAAGIGLDQLDLAIGAFGHRVGDAVFGVGQESRQMALQDPGSSDDRGKTRMGRPEVPAIEELLRGSGVMVVPEPGKGLLDGPGVPHLEGVELERVKVAALALGEVLRVLEPQVLRLRERPYPLS